MESSFLALELVHEHRNYLPGVGLVLAFFYYLLAPGKHNESAKIRAIMAVAVLFLFAGATFVRAGQWGDAVELKLKEVDHHPNSIRTNIDAAAFYAATPATNAIDAEDYYQQAYKHYVKASELSKTDTLGLEGLIALNARNNLQLEPSWVSALAKRIENNPFTPNTGNALMSLNKCVIGNNCKNAADVMDLLFQSAMRNPTLRGQQRAQLMFAQSDFEAQVRHDSEKSISLAQQALAMSPSDLDFLMNVAIIYTTLGMKAEAYQQIEKIRTLDKNALYSAKLTALEAVLKSIASPDKPHS
jgi:hypothetical protein